MKRNNTILLFALWTSIGNCYSPEILIDHIKQSIQNAIEERSKLSTDVLALDGMSSAKVRHFLNNLCSLPGAHYLEIGVFKGSTFIAALFGNDDNLADALAIDNWSQFGYQKEFFLTTVADIIPSQKYRFVESDCFSVNLKDYFTEPVDIYFYDGNHSSGSHRRAFTYYNSIFADVFIAVIDDWNWQEVQEGTRKAFRELNYNILFEQELPARYNGDYQEWWHGVYVAVIQR